MGLYMGLCEDIVQRMEEVVNRGGILNERQCRFLATRFSVKIACVREVLESDKVHKPAFVPLLRTLYRYFAKAEVLVNQCGEEDWCAAAVFQGCYPQSFTYIMLCVNHVCEILECVENFPLDINARRFDEHRINIFSDSIHEFFRVGVNDDKKELLKRLEDLTTELSSSSLSISVPKQADVKQHLARYLLRRFKHNFNLIVGSNNPQVFETILWEKEDEPTGVWGNSKFLGAGSGASGVCQTRWLGVPCAKKEFHEEVSESTFRKEVVIMAMSKHPCVVDFICCGNGKEKGDRFIAMELMEKSLYDLIKEQKGVHFSLDVALDIIWQIAEGVDFLHKNGVAYRDLKPQIVVVNTVRPLYHEDYCCVKLVDFGTSKSIVEVSRCSTMSFRGIGTTRYRAPKAHPSASGSLKGLAKVDWFRVDVYSFAMTCAHLLSLKQPFDDMESISNLYNILIKGYRPFLPEFYPKKLTDLVEDCWQTARTKRPKFGAIYSRLQIITFNNLKYLIMLPRNKVGKYYTIEHCESKKESGNMSFYTAQYISLCDAITSEERDLKSNVSKRCKLEFE